jgi:transposase, IS30 family
MVKGYTHPCAEDRERIAVLLAQGWSVRAIARALHRSISTISREVWRNEEEPYCGVSAQQRAQCPKRKPRRPARRRRRGSKWTMA